MSHRVCPACLKAVDASLFTSKDPRTNCSPCRSAKNKKRNSDWQAANRQRVNEKTRRHRANRYQLEGRWRDSSPKSVALASWMAELKSKPCADCNRSFEACCMDFDHRDGTTKSYNVGSMFAHHYSRELIETELQKCELVCSNCHRIRTRDRRIGSGNRKTLKEAA